MTTRESMILKAMLRLLLVMAAMVLKNHPGADALADAIEAGEDLLR